MAVFAKKGARLAIVPVEIKDGLGWVTIDNPPVNAIGRAVRQGVLDPVAQLRGSDVRAVVLTGAGRAFVAGADIRELGQTPVAPFLPDGLAAIADSPAPWVAALGGLTLGGGLELAMACHARIAVPEAKLGSGLL
ncbi:enoyl-CoA hydratase/isomerase family protein [Primorskyibacter sp. 2E107]|uniref:enoyl-CoA hydratase/isomerase family protein n=1 Tax=Primorskyibacter sp. 2E107 TaxID=3403458 RepID=UPI003AF98868